MVVPTLRHLCDHAYVWQPQKKSLDHQLLKDPFMCLICVPGCFSFHCLGLQRYRAVISSFVFHLIHNVLPRPHCSFTALILFFMQQVFVPRAFIMAYLSMFIPGLLSMSVVNSSSTPAPFSRVLCSLVPLGRKCVFAQTQHEIAPPKKRKQKRFVPEATTDTLVPATYSLCKQRQLHNRKQVSHPPCALALMRMRTSLLTKRSSLYMKVVHFQSTHLQRPPSPPRPPHGPHKQVAPMPSKEAPHSTPESAYFSEDVRASSAFLAQELPCRLRCIPSSAPRHNRQGCASPGHPSSRRSFA